jgi:hypothetical protein
MSESPEIKAFFERQPSLTLEEVATNINAGNIATSFRTLPAVRDDRAVGHLTVKFALMNGQFHTVLLDRLVANALLSLIEHMNSLDWDAKMMVPSSTPH